MTQLWGGDSVASARDEEAFEDYARGRTAQNVQFVAPLIVLAAVLWWPLDFIFFDDPDTQLRLAIWRLAGSALCLACFSLFRGASFAKAHPLLVYATVCTSCAFLTGAVLSGAGGEGRPFLQGSYLLPWASFVYFGALRARVVNTALLIGGWLAATILFHPATLDYPNFSNSLAFLVFCGALCVVAGHIIFRLSRQSFLQARALAAQAEELRLLNDELEERVAERTLDLRSLAARQTTALEDERSRIARDIHDDLGQALGALRLEVDVAEAHLTQADGAQPSPLGVSLARLKMLLGETLGTSRRLLSQLRPRVLEDLGLPAAMEWLLSDFRARHGIGCALRIKPEGLVVESSRALALFRVLQECLTNVARHADAKHVVVELDESVAGIHLCIGDDGIGGVAASTAHGRTLGTKAGRGVGMIGMRERVAQFGGRFSCESPPGRGTRIGVVLPHAALAAQPPLPAGAS